MYLKNLMYVNKSLRTTNDHACIYIGRCIARLSEHFFIKQGSRHVVNMLIGQMRCNARDSEHNYYL